MACTFREFRNFFLNINPAKSIVKEHLLRGESIDQIGQGLFHPFRVIRPNSWEILVLFNFGTYATTFHDTNMLEKSKLI